jgi:hypothetical protein
MKMVGHTMGRENWHNYEAILIMGRKDKKKWQKLNCFE